MLRQLFNCIFLLTFSLTFLKTKWHFIKYHGLPVWVRKSSLPSYKIWPLWGRSISILLDLLYLNEWYVLSVFYKQRLLLCKITIWTGWERAMLQYFYRRYFVPTQRISLFCNVHKNSSTKTFEEIFEGNAQICISSLN